MLVIETYIIVAALVILSGLFSRLTLGLMSLNTYTLQRKVQLGDKDASRVYPLRKTGNLLLTTLLLGNVAVNSANFSMTRGTCVCCSIISDTKI